MGSTCSQLCAGEGRGDEPIEDKFTAVARNSASSVPDVLPGARPSAERAEAAAQAPPSALAGEIAPAPAAEGAEGAAPAQEQEAATDLGPESAPLDLWDRLQQLAPPPQLPAPRVEIGDLVTLRGVAKRPELDGKGATVLPGPSADALELELEGAERERLCVPRETATKLPGFPEMGVSLAFLREFRKVYKDRVQGKTTAEVCENIIKPLTRSAQSALVDALQRPEMGSLGNKEHFTGRATIFVSHAWKYKFEQLIDALEAYAELLGDLEAARLWLDVFVVNQHASVDKPKIWWTKTFQNAIRSIGRTCLVLSPWNALIPLTRAWCIWEMASVAQTKTMLDIALSVDESADFERALQKDFKSIASSLSRIDIRWAEACYQSDKEMILNAAESTVGLSKLNEQVLGLMREWLAQAGRDALAKLPEEERGTSSLLCNLAGHLLDQGHLSESERLLRESVAARRRDSGERGGTLDATREVLGAQHPDTLTSMNNLASVLYNQGKLAEAEGLLWEVLKAAREVLGARHPDTMASMNNLANVLSAQGKLADAERLHRETLKAMGKVWERGTRTR